MTDTSATDDSPPSLDVLVLPAFAAEDFRLPGEEAVADTQNELDYWLDAYDFDREVRVPGANAPVRYTDDGVGITTTGMGKTAAATTVSALLGSPEIDLSDAYFVTAGVAGAPPSAATVGAVFVADAVVDWDLKHRWSDGEDDPSESGAGASPIDLLKYRPHDYVHRLDDDLVATATEIAEAVDLRDADEATAYCDQYAEETAQSSPFVGVGATVCGDEFWHGRPFSEQAAWLVEQYDAGVYATSEMEDFGTATALANFGKLDRYLSIRGVVNFDQPAPGQSAYESLNDGGLFLDLGVENAFRVASAVVDSLVQ